MILEVTKVLVGGLGMVLFILDRYWVFGENKKSMEVGKARRNLGATMSGIYK